LALVLIPFLALVYGNKTGGYYTSIWKRVNRGFLWLETNVKFVLPYPSYGARVLAEDMSLMRER
jgi:hypothetical protein